jgi:formylglycine-generating enzyme required for sulfatase activity
VADVFISYKSERRAAAEHLAATLTRYGYSVWFDYALVKGRDFGLQIDAKVRSAKVLIVMWCTLSVQSRWVHEEVDLAHELGILAPLKIEACDLPVGNRRVDYINLVDWDGSPRSPLLDDLLDTVGGKVGRAPAPDFQALRDYEATWRRFGALPLRAFALTRPLETVEAARGIGAAGVAERALAPEPPPPPAGPPAFEAAWAAIEASLDKSHYQRFEQRFDHDPLAFARVIEAEARAKALERWETVDQTDPDAIAEAIRSGFFPALEQLAKETMQRAAEAKQRAFEQALAERRAREAAEAEARRQSEAAARKAEEERLAKPRRAAEAAKAGRPVAERAFPIELPGLANWPSPQMIAIPPGKFMMGSPKNEERSSVYDGREEPQHEVRIDYAFALGQHTVTVDAFKAFVTETNHDTGKSAYVWNGKEWKDTPGKGWRDPGFAQTGAHPVCCVNWEDAQAYLAWLNDKAGLAGRPDAYRLPSEAEWEYACRAGTTTPFSFGPTISTAQANYDGNYTYGPGKKGEYRHKTTPVGSFPANGFGIFDMHGNVWEWCQDCRNANYNGAPSDGSAWTTGDCSARVLRGGSWYNYPYWLRSASRYWDVPSFRDDGRGFRLARTLFTP